MICIYILVEHHIYTRHININYTLHSYTVYYYCFAFNGWYTIYMDGIYTTYTTYIPRIYHVYTTYIPHIYHIYTTYIPRIYHVYTTYIPHIYHIYTTYIPRIYHVYTTYIPYIYTTYIPRIYHVYAIAAIRSPLHTTAVGDSILRVPEMCLALTFILEVKFALPHSLPRFRCLGVTMHGWLPISDTMPTGNPGEVRH